ncbi:hypothetical protein [Xenorhabdus sp. BG5]|uniref:hypothetical protein n=1 Tax=Xenorhabdus sp. BG5 TaxID=2782014 RepID=UPI00187F7319|nr:hypothetical protein [Xenorhabdus sp. BG5]MBE8596255.1 hypothetical protein [Xenorhabdus sp. BG5]
MAGDSSDFQKMDHADPRLASCRGVLNMLSELFSVNALGYNEDNIFDVTTIILYLANISEYDAYH